MINYMLMNSGHVSQVAALDKQCFSEPWSERSVASELENPLSLWIVAMDGEQLAGYVGSQSVMGESDMMNLAVAEEYRRRGIGKNLVLKLIEALRDREIHSLTLEVRESNIPAQKLYCKIGFQVVGNRPRYYYHPRENAIILKKEWAI